MFHYSSMGEYAPITRDMDGYVPEAGDGPWDFAVDHGTERTHDDGGELTEYGQWWEEEGFPQWRDRAIEETKFAEEGLAQWQE